MGIYKLSCKKRSQTITYVYILKEDLGIYNINEMMTLMLDRGVWRENAKKI